MFNLITEGSVCYHPLESQGLVFLSVFLKVSDAFNIDFLFLRPSKENAMLLPSLGEQNYAWLKPSGRQNKPRLSPRTTSSPVSCYRGRRILHLFSALVWHWSHGFGDRRRPQSSANITKCPINVDRTVSHVTANPVSFCDSSQRQLFHVTFNPKRKSLFEPNALLHSSLLKNNNLF